MGDTELLSFLKRKKKLRKPQLTMTTRPRVTPRTPMANAPSQPQRAPISPIRSQPPRPSQPLLVPMVKTSQTPPLLTVLTSPPLTLLMLTYATRRTRLPQPQMLTRLTLPLQAARLKEERIPNLGIFAHLRWRGNSCCCHSLLH